MKLADLGTAEQTEAQAAWVLRRVGFGATVADLDWARTIGLNAFLNELFEPDAHGVAEDGDPWADVELAERVLSRNDVAPLIAGWLERMLDHTRPVTEWLAWFWHGHLTSSISIVKSPLAMANQIRLFRDIGGGPLRDLLGAITIDAAMLRYLDGNQNTGRAPNENYSRELLELFALGNGNFTEADVLAGAKALSGWTRTRESIAESQFRPRRHDDTPQTYLGVNGVNDVDTVIDAVVAHEACARFITRSLGEMILGPTAVATAEDAEAAAFAADDLAVLRLVRRLVEIGIGGQADVVAVSPLLWIVGALRATETRLPQRQLTNLIRLGGQVPMAPPNVSGWPTGDAWFSTSSTAARLQAARLIADASPTDSAPSVAANRRDLDALARSLGLPLGFTAPTADALLATETSGKTLLALALSTPDLAVA